MHKASLCYLQLFSVAVLAFFSQSKAEAETTWQYKNGGTFYNLQNCQRLLSKTLQCSFDIKNDQRDIIYAHQANSVVISSPTGKTAVLHSYEFAGQYYAASLGKNIKLKKSQTYNLKLNFIDFPENEISSLEIVGAGTNHNIIVGKSVGNNTNTEPSTLSIKSTTKTTNTSTRRTGRTRKLPDSKWMHKVEVGDGLYTAIVHGCYKTSRPQFASCLVSLIPLRAEGSIMNQITVYPASLMKLDDQKILIDSSTVDLRVGDQIFQNVPVK